MQTKRKTATVHRVNDPYYPLGFLGGEYCVKCGKDWPCNGDDKPKGINDDD